jgi:CRISPR-associated protein Csm3
MYAKIIVTGNLTIKTGLHIGGSDAFAAIGATDSPVIKDPLSGLPLIPGSSLKGKMRTLLAKMYNESVADSPNSDHDRIKRVFGASEGTYKTARLLFGDMILANSEELEKRLDSLTEVKFENSINRLTAEANPRQIERAVRGSAFDLELIYEITNGKDGAISEDEIFEDFALIADGLRLVEYDYLGGSGSRGYGKVAIENLAASAAVGNPPADLLEKINEKLKGAA